MLVSKFFSTVVLGSISSPCVTKGMCDGGTLRLCQCIGMCMSALSIVHPHNQETPLCLIRYS